MRTVPGKTVYLTKDELDFLQACYDASSSEGHFQHDMERDRFTATRESLLKKGVLQANGIGNN